MTIPPAAAPDGIGEDREHLRARGRREIDGVADDDRRDDLLRPALLARVIGRAAPRPPPGRANGERCASNAIRRRSDRVHGASAGLLRWSAAPAYGRQSSRKNHTPCRPRVRRLSSIAPDSFKGSLARPAICAAIARGLRRVWPDVEIRACPMADGGEGTLDAVLSRGGERQDDAASPAPAAKQRTAAYGIVDAPEGATAIIEAAEIVGITDPDGMAVDVTARSTTGRRRVDRARCSTRACAGS